MTVDEQIIRLVFSVPVKADMIVLTRPTGIITACTPLFVQSRALRWVLDYIAFIKSEFTDRRIANTKHPVVGNRQCHGPVPDLIVY